MKDVLGRFGFTDFLTIVCPGLFLLLTLAVWIPETSWSGLKPTDLDPKKLDSVLLAVLLVLLAYAFGLVASVLTSEGAILRQHLVPSNEPRLWRRQLLVFFSAVLWFLQGTLDSPLKKSSVVEALMRLGGRLAELAGGVDRLPASPYELVNAFRVFVTGYTDNSARPLIDEADQVCRRRIFGQGMALALALLAVQGVLVVSLKRWQPILLVLAAIAMAASFGLRYAAARLWEQELLYTYRIYLMVTPDASQT